MCWGSLVGSFEVADASSMGHLGLTGEDPSEPCLDLPETAGEIMGETKTLGTAVTRVGGRQNPNPPEP